MSQAAPVNIGYRFSTGWTPPVAPRPHGFAMKRIVEEVASRYGVCPQDLTGPGRYAVLCKARFEAMWIIYQERWPDGRRVYSLPHIGAYFNRDHTTVLNALRRHEERSGFAVKDGVKALRTAARAMQEAVSA